MDARPIDQITQTQITELVVAALSEFYLHDSQLLHYGNDDITASERAMAFRIGTYIERHFHILQFSDGLSIDMEYNRNMHEPKRIHTLFKQHQRRNVIPDLLIHRRQSNQDNLLVIEFKKGNPPLHEKNSDAEKLSYFTDSRSEYRYRFGMYIELHYQDALIEIYRNGHLTESFRFL